MPVWGRFSLQHRDGFGERHDALAVVAEGADRDGAFLGLALADDEQIGDFGEAVFAVLVVDLLVPEVAFSADRSDEHTSELQSLMRIWYAVFCLTKTTYILLAI